MQNSTSLKTFFLTVAFFGLLSSASFAEIVGTDNFEPGGKTGWDWNGTVQNWSKPVPTETDSGNTRAKIVNDQLFLSYNSGQLTSGTFAYTFDMQLPTATGQWGGLSLYSDNSEKLFFGKMSASDDSAKKLSIRNYGSSQTAYTSDDYMGSNHTYAVVANPTGIFAWAYDLGTTPKYEDLYTNPTLQLASTLSGNNRFRLGTSGTMYFDNIKMAYSDSSTIASKGDATSTTALTDIFGAVPEITCIKESFSKYEGEKNINIVGQFQKNLGQAPLTKWTGSNATRDSSRNLEYSGWSSEPGVLYIYTGCNAKMTLDSNVMADWGVMGTDGLIGGTGVSDETLYYGFLVQSAGQSGTWSMGPELYRNGKEVLGLSYHSWTSTTDFAGVYRDAANKEYRLDFANDKLDTDTHLFVVKLSFSEDGVADDALIFIDPNMALSEEEQDLLHVYKLSELTGLSNQDLSFDSITFRGENAWTYDELRLAKTWWALSDFDAPSVPEPSTWALLILGATGIFCLRKRNGKW